MSLQTGIKANDQLMKTFSKCRDGKIRVIKISIENEELTVANKAEVRGDWQSDYDKMIKPLIDDDTPCYILYRLDSKTPLGHGWLLLSWSPDTAKTRQKMMYASTKATLKLEFGSAHIIEEIHATTKDETTLDGYFKIRKAEKHAAEIFKEPRNVEVNTEISTSTRQQTLSGIHCPITPAANDAIKHIISGASNYAQFSIDLKREEIDLVKHTTIELKELPKCVPTENARYHLFVFKHNYESDYYESVVFVYSCPGYACPVKERMLYSSSKGLFISTIEGMGLPITKKLEIDNGDDLSEDNLIDEIHPKKMLHRPQFAKPKGPPSRGPKRLTKTQD